VHTKKEEIIICYHGNKEHLEQLSQEIISSLELINTEKQIRLKAIYNIKQYGLWTKNCPRIKIDHIQWNINSIQDEINSSDIGICPGLSPLLDSVKKPLLYLSKIFSAKKLGNQNDYLTRFKVTSNAGRAFVFHQLGIPVISDIFPDAYHILQDHNCGYLAHNTNSWVYALRRLSRSHQHRQFISDSAREQFNAKYNTRFLTERFAKEIHSIYLDFN
jgi:hypothetical protein